MKLSRSPNINHLWGALIIEELIRQKAGYFCLSPGSRSSPLTVAAGLNPKAKSFVHYDERGTAFHALGYVSASGKPAVVISTSGTAAANFLPAVIEAAKKKLPLIILTADRPPELRKTGADQAIEQVGIYGEYVRWQYDFPCPDQAIKPEFVLTTVDQAIQQAQGTPPGPVHLNCMFREPLAPTKQRSDFKKYIQGIAKWTEGKLPYTRYVPAVPVLAENQGQEIIAELKKIKKGIIVTGKLGNPRTQDAVVRLSGKLNWPVFPDISSGLRLGSVSPNIIHHYDQLLLSDKFKKNNKPDGILHLGGRITSKRWYQFIESASPRHYIMVNHHPLRNDPLHNVSVRVESSIQDFCGRVLSTGNLAANGRPERVARLQRLSAAAEKTITGFTNIQKKLNEPVVARLISEHIPAQSGLFLASSLPVREMDMYAHGKKNTVTVGANRGASGIDGTIATAAGFAAALNKPVTLLIGDLAFLHDLNSLNMLRSLKKPFVVVILNNNGGGIFSFLPIAEFKPTFEKYFGTPHDLEFSSAAKLFGLNYAKPDTKSAFVRAYAKALKNQTASVIEVKTTRAETCRVNQSLQKKIKTAVDKVLQPGR